MDTQILFYLQRIDLALYFIVLVLACYLCFKGLRLFIRLFKLIYRKVKRKI